MNLRFHLFGKIFIGFWLATIAVLASWMLSALYFDTGPDRDAVERRPHGPPQRFILRMIYDLQNLDETELRSLLAKASDEHEVDIYLLDPQGKDLFDRKVPSKVGEISQELRGSRRRAFLKGEGEHLLAYEIYRPDNGLLRAVFVFRHSSHQLLGLLGSSLGLRMGLAVLISGLVCYLLSRLLTNRISQLQVASQKLATGQLDTRLAVRNRGGDETDELARAFNSMAQQLQERIEVQKRLLGDVSHELRSPLARMRVAIALAQKNPDKVPDYLQRMERETERLEELIGQLLDTQGGEIELDDHIDLVALLQQLCNDANFEGTAEGKRVVFGSGIDEAMIASSGDLLHKSFENILRNGLSHTRGGTEVSINLIPLEEGYQISVTDHGGGVPEPELEKIFETFYRTDTARSRDTGGYGLGLAIAHRAILRHRGKVWAENKQTGLVVKVFLPRV